MQPKARHPSSIMQLSNTGGAGRGSQTGNIIGDVINHGKKKFWGSVLPAVLRDGVKVRHMLPFSTSLQSPRYALPSGHVGRGQHAERPVSA